MSTINTVLVANRGEIALRIVRGAHDRGLNSVAVYADSDRGAHYVREADEAYSLAGSSAQETYLDGEKILEIARRSGADAIHPGYGFLAENPDFAAAVAEAGLSWVGPSAQSILALGDKVQARQVAQRVGVSPVPGTDEPLTGRADVEAFIAQHDYPVILKRADGGGGRGISVIANETDLDHFFTGRDDDSLGAYFVERYIPRARHIETQCGRDKNGNFAVYSTRDCSVQRRHQKLIEEAPAPYLPADAQVHLVDASRRLFEGVDYTGLGTCEFLMDPQGNIYFLEVNPRLQVEHTVTEEVTGIDLVGQQLKIAAGENLDAPGPVRGHSVEFRITSEDPRLALSPSLGTLSKISWPTGPGIRIDTGVEEGNEVTPEFDSMIAKLIVTGENREHALLRSKRALAELKIDGVGTPVSLYQQILERPEFSGALGDLEIWTRWLEEEILPGFLAQFEGEESVALDAPVSTAPQLTHFTIEINGQRHELALPTSMLQPQMGAAAPARPAQPLRSQRESRAEAQAAATDPNVVASPLQAIVVRVGVEPGQDVAEGDLLLVLESMKMEKYVHAHRDGVAEEILVSAGDNVGPGQALVKLRPLAEEIA